MPLLRSLALGALVCLLGVGTGAKADELCNAQGEIAETVMQARQDGVSKKAAMDFADRGDALVQPMVREMVRLAYNKPQMKTKQDRRNQVRSFAAAIRRDCVRDLN